MCIVFRDKHANDRAAVVMFVIPPLPHTDQLFKQVLSLSAASPPVRRFKADALAETFSVQQFDEVCKETDAFSKPACAVIIIDEVIRLRPE